MRFLDLASAIRSTSAWEALVRADPSAADAPSIGERDRLILDALTPEQAEACFRNGAEPQNLLLDDAGTLQDYLDARLNPATAGKKRTEKNSPAQL